MRRYIMRRLLLLPIIASAACAETAPPDLSVESPDLLDPRNVESIELCSSRQVIVLLRQDAKELPVQASRVLSAVSTRLSDRTSARIVEKLGNPIKARYALSIMRLSDEALAQFPADSPEARMHRYVLLEYESKTSAEDALVLLKGHADVQSAQLNHRIQSSVAPNDPYVSSPLAGVAASQYQWGLQAMNLPAAWSITTGWGYVTVVDNGIMVNHPALQKAYARNMDWYIMYDDDGNQIANSGEVDEIGGPLGSLVAAGHGTHVAGIIAATADNAQGVSGVCPGCALMIAKTADFSDANYPDGGNFQSHGSGIYAGAVVGAQAINMSWGRGTFPSAPAFEDCTEQPVQFICDAIQVAVLRQVTLVAAAGNANCSGFIQFPANDNRVIPVGGIDITGARWVEAGMQTCSADSEAGSNTGSQLRWRGMVAPAKSVLSTWYAGELWNQASGCPQNDANGELLYDACTGTSMSAPHITALSVLARSTNPLLTSAAILVYMRQAGPKVTAPTDALGAGLPNAQKAVNSASLTANKLTPLFAFWNSANRNRFYTAVPQMGTAARTGYLFPNGGTNAAYVPEGNTVPNFFVFPGDPTAVIPRAQAWVFTTRNNPFNPAVPLVPLTRFSWACNIPDLQSHSSCLTWPSKTDHSYSTDRENETGYFEALGYRVDGTEGFIYPATEPQQPGMVPLLRRRHPVWDDIAIFPETSLASMQSLGYNEIVNGQGVLGWVYPNNGVRPAY